MIKAIRVKDIKPSTCEWLIRVYLYWGIFIESVGGFSLPSEAHEKSAIINIQDASTRPIIGNVKSR